MGTRTYSRRGANGERILTALGRQRATQQTASSTTVAGLAPSAYIDAMNNNIASLVSRYLQGDTSIVTVRTAVDDLQKKVSAFTEAEQQALVDSPNLYGEVMIALGVFGTSRIREQVAQIADTAQANKDAGRYNQLMTMPNGDEIDLTLRLHGQYATQFILNNTLEGQEVFAKRNGESVIENFFLNHALNNNSFWPAHWQHMLSFVGPNADVPRDRTSTFFPKGMTIPEVNPRYIQMMNEEYERVQAELARQGITEVKLYRGTTLNRGVPLEPWSPSKSVAQKFMGIYKKLNKRANVTMYEDTIPAKYFLGHWKITPNWPERDVVGKKEHMVAGLAYAYDTNRLPEFPELKR